MTATGHGGHGAVIVRTERLALRELTPEDAPFILELLNEPPFLEQIGDRGVRDLEQARAYIVEGPVASYAAHGFGLWCVEREDVTPVGICGLLRRPVLTDVDVGFALLRAHWSHGYALEAARATLRHGYEILGLARIVAIVSPGNERSIALLERLGLQCERRVQLAPDDDEVLPYGPRSRGRS